MPRRSTIKRATEIAIGLTRLALIAVGGAFAVVVLFLLGNVALYLAARIAEKLFDLIKVIFGG